MKKSPNEVWVKRWAGSYTFISCDYWGPQYFTSLKKYLGKGFAHSLFIHRKGVVSFYLLRSEYEYFGKAMAKEAAADPRRTRKLLQDLKRNSDHIVACMDSMKGTLPTRRQYQKFLVYFDRHLPLHNFMKKTVDFLPQEAGKKLMPYFRDARVYTERVYSDTEKFFRKLAGVIAKRLGYRADYLTCLTQEELERYLQKGTLPTKEILRKRYVGSALIFEKGQRQILYGTKVAAMERKIFASLSSQAATLQGTSVYQGKVTGVVRIVRDPHKPGRFNKGDILVTGMTRPEFLALIKKAGAIVTDAGGVLCHAAIAARELRKPCIVGTEVATRVLKSGRIICVDARRGIISIVK